MKLNHRSAQGSVLIIGAGPGIGLAVARRFSRDGRAVGLVARSPDSLASLARELRSDGVTTAWQTADITQTEELRAAIRSMHTQLGPIDVLCFSPLPSLSLIRPVLDTTPQAFIESFSLNVAGAAAAVAEVLPGMIEREDGILLFTTGSAALHPSPDRAASVVTTVAETAYVELLYRTLEASGVRVAQLAIEGPVGRDAMHDPDDVAEALWEAITANNGPLAVLGRTEEREAS